MGEVLYGKTTVWTIKKVRKTDLPNKIFGQIFLWKCTLLIKIKLSFHREIELPLFPVNIWIWNQNSACLKLSHSYWIIVSMIHRICLKAFWWQNSLNSFFNTRSEENFVFSNFNDFYGTNEFNLGYRIYIFNNVIENRSSDRRHSIILDWWKCLPSTFEGTFSEEKTYSPSCFTYIVN